MDLDLKSIPHHGHILTSYCAAIWHGCAATSGRNWVVHAINQLVQIFLADERTGQLLNTTNPAQVSLAQFVTAAGIPEFDLRQSKLADPTAFYDVKERRYVLAWAALVCYNDLDVYCFDGATVSDNGRVKPNFFVAVSASSDPTGSWVVRALSPRPPVTVRPLCDTAKEEFDYPQVSL